MKKKILILTMLILLSSFAYATVPINYTDDFEHGTTGNWTASAVDDTISIVSTPTLNDTYALRDDNLQAGSTNAELPYDAQYNGDITFSFAWRTSSCAGRPAFTVTDASNTLTNSIFIYAQAGTMWRYYDGSDYQDIINCVSNQNQYWVIIRKDLGATSTFDLYINGTQHVTDGLDRGSLATVGFFNFAQSLSGTYVYIDNFNSCTGQHPTGCPITTNSAPTIILKSPINNDHLNDDPVLINFNVTDVDDDLINCTLYINGSSETTFNNVNTTSNAEQYYNYSELEGTNNWNVSCTDGTVTTGSNNETFVIDRTTPDVTINTINTDNTTKFDRELQSWIYWNDTIDDTYLFAYNITAKYPNGSVWFNNYTINLNVTLFNYTWNSTISATQPNGTYSVNYYAEDDHTKLFINDYNYYIDNEGLWFSFENYYINIRADIPSQVKTINTTKLEDRYTFEFEYNNGQPSRTYRLQSNEKMYYRGNLYEYPVFVIGDNWVDFNVDTEGVEYVVTKVNDNEYKIEIKRLEPSDTEIIRSLGGLNVVDETYTFIISENIPPNITSTTPTQNFSVNDGIQINFTTTATDFDNDTLTYEYFFDDVSENSSQNFTWTAPFDNHGLHNMTIVVTDTAGKNDTYTWHINITHNNIGGNVTSLTRSSGIWYSNSINTTFICIGVDLDNETPLTNLTAEIYYRTSISWTSLNATNNGSGTFTADINVSTLEGETLDVRCRVDDGEDVSDYYTVLSIVTIQPEYTAIGNIISINPSNTSRDFVTSVTCNAESFNTIPSYQIIYDIDAYYNGAWHNISNNFFNKALYDMALINYTQKVSFRCRAKDGTTTTAFLESGNVTREHKTNIIMFDRGMDEVTKSHKPYYKGLYADFYDEIGVTILSSFVDCNGDGFFDYYFEYSDGRNTTKEHFLCYNKEGIIKHTVGVFINKTNSTTALCGIGKTGTCRIQREYGVLLK